MAAVPFDRFFETATGKRPFPYQRRLAQASSLPDLLRVETGYGEFGRSARTPSPVRDGAVPVVCETRDAVIPFIPSTLRRTRLWRSR